MYFGAIFPSFRSSKNKKVNKHFKIRRPFQNSTTRPNDMIHTQSWQKKLAL